MRSSKNLMIVVVLISAAAASVDRTCDSDTYCAKNFNDSYYCEMSSKLCRRIPVYQNLDTYSIIGLVLNFLFSILASSIGVSSGGMIYCFLIFCMQLTTKDTIPILKVSNLFASLINIFFILRKRREDNQDELYIDWSLAAYSIPYVLSGGMIGMLANEYFPGIYLISLMFITLLVLAWLTWKESMRLEKEEEEGNCGTNLTVKTWGRNTNCGSDFLKTLTVVERKTLLDIIKENFISILVMCAATFTMIAGNLIKGSTSFKSVIGIEAGSSLAFVLYLSACLVTASTSYVVKSKVDINYSSKTKLKIAIFSFLSGALLSLGITGSLAYSSFLVILGIEPLVVSALSAFMLFFTSIAMIAQFLVIGYLDITNSVFIGLFALAGSVIGNFGMSRSLGKSLGAQSIIPYILFIVLVLTIVVMPFSALQEYYNNPDFLNYGVVC